MLVRHIIRTISKQNPATGRYNFPGIKNTNINNIAATTITNSSGFTITKTDDNNYTFGAGTNALFSGTGGGGLASAGPVTIEA